MKEIRVIELFAGVGGFRLGLKKASTRFKIVWSNQFEPSAKVQAASDVYVSRFGPVGHSNQDIAKVHTSDIPDHAMLVGGFPCQDYSVARTLNQAEGLIGKKGVLWWEIHRIVKEKRRKPHILFLENVDRLLSSPAQQKGRDFAIMLTSLSDLGYAVEWRVINAADYGMPQRRRRTFILAYHKGTEIYKQLRSTKDRFDWVENKGILAEAFKISISQRPLSPFEIIGDLSEVSEDFNTNGHSSPFKNSGMMMGRQVYSASADVVYGGPKAKLKDIILTNGNVPEDYYIHDDSLPKWLYLKGAKNAQRVNKATGFEYRYSEGAMRFPDPLDEPSRTVVTGEGGSTPSRFKHVIETADGRLRRLTPVELERLNMFPDGHTAGAPDIKRAFFMGNALVVGVVERIGKVIAKRMKS